MIRVIVVAGFVALAPFASANAAPGISNSDKAVESASDPNAVVCRRDSVVGSRVSKRRVCMTRREFERLANGTRNAVGIYLKEITSRPPPSN